MRFAAPWICALGLCVLGLTLGACHADATGATPAQCRAIFNRLVEVELEEMGYRDPVLAERRQADLARRYQSEIEECVGKAIPPGAMACIVSAETAEGLSHECLR